MKQIPKRASLSPSRGPVSNGVKTGVVKNRGYSNGNDDVNPVLMGTKMVERVVNMRKLAPPREDRVVNQNNTSGKLSVSQDNAGFGRTLSKKSFDMALRHLVCFYDPFFLFITLDREMQVVLRLTHALDRD